MKEEKRKFINFQTFFIFSLLRFCVFLLSHFFFYFLLYVFVHRLPVLDFCNMQKKIKKIQSMAKSREICIEIRYLTIEISRGIKSNIAASTALPFALFFSSHSLHFYLYIVISLSVVSTR